MPLVTSSVRSVRLGVHFTPRTSLVSFYALTDLYMFMKALAFWRWLTHALPLSVMIRVLLFGLLSVSGFSYRHISLIPFASSTLRCQIPHFTSIVSWDNSSFRLLYASVWMPSLRRTSSRSLNLSMISFVIQHCSDGRLRVMEIGLWYEDRELHGDQSRSSWRNSCTMVTPRVEKPPVEGSWWVGAPVFRKAPLAFSIVSPGNSPLSVCLATGSQSGSWAFRSAQMTSSCWISVWISKSEKPTLCGKLKVSEGKYQLSACIFFW